MRLWKFFARLVTGSAMLLTVLSCGFGIVGCAEETLECCKCQFAGCLDPKGMPAPQTICTCTGFTYEECGLYCAEDVPPALAAQGLTMCGEASPVLAVDAC